MNSPNGDLPKSNVLAAIGSAVLTSVICSWTITVHFQGQTQLEFDRIHARLNAMTPQVVRTPGHWPADKPLDAPAATED